MEKVKIDNWLILGITFLILALTHLLILVKHLKHFQKFESMPCNWILQRIVDKISVDELKKFKPILIWVFLIVFVTLMVICQFFFLQKLCNRDITEEETFIINDFIEDGLWLVWIVLPVFILFLYLSFFGHPGSKPKDVIINVIWMSHNHLVLMEILWDTHTHDVKITNWLTFWLTFLNWLLLHLTMLVWLLTHDENSKLW